MIIEGKDVASPIQERADVCVIGSGAGGAYVAHRLANRGLSVVVLEEGGAYFRADLTGRVRDAITALYRNCGLDLALGTPSILVPTGKCLGGTTVINMGVCFRAPDTVLSAWKSSGLDGYGPSEMAPIYDEVEELMSVQPVKPDVMGRTGEVIAEGALKLGLHPKAIRRAVSDDCRGCGNCAYGCTEDAKQSMTVRLIPEASRAGARFYCDVRAQEIVHDRYKALGVKGRVIDRATGAPVQEVAISARTVVLAAGALGTPCLLLSNRIGRRGTVGAHLKLHLCLRTTGVFPDEIDGFRGVCQNVYIDDYHDRGIMLEATFTGPCTQIPGLPGNGEQFWDLCKRYRNMASIGVLTSEKAEGRVRGSIGGVPVVTFQVTRQDADVLHEGMLEAGRILFAAGAEKVINGSYVSTLLNSNEELEEAAGRNVLPKDLMIMAFHPQGTCRMGTDRRTSVVGPTGECHELNNLFIADASVFPTSVGVNPQETIWAVAHKVSDAIAQVMR